MRRASAVLAAWVALLALTACQRLGAPAVSLPPELAPPPGATEVTPRSAGEMAAVAYRLAARYPAQPFLDDLSARLTSRGWKPMEHDFLNPTIPTSNVRGWTAFVDGTSKPPVGIHQWMGGWTNPTGAIVSYVLIYKSSANGIDLPPPDDASLSVTAFLVPAERAREMAAEAELSRKK